MAASRPRGALQCAPRALPDARSHHDHRRGAQPHVRAARSPRAAPVSGLPTTLSRGWRATRRGTPCGRSVPSGVHRTHRAASSRSPAPVARGRRQRRPRTGEPIDGRTEHHTPNGCQRRRRCRASSFSNVRSISAGSASGRSPLSISRTRSTGIPSSRASSATLRASASRRDRISFGAIGVDRVTLRTF